MPNPSMPPKPVNRRDFLAAGGALASAFALGACDSLQTSPDNSGEDAAGADNGPEAPMLAERVQAGELPEVADRLPDNPVVVQPNDRIGSYGGTWSSVLEGGPEGSYGWLDTTVGHENLTRWDPQFTELLPNVAEQYETSDDGTQVTFTLRKGMRWSDGEPFTADDLVFAHDDVMLNTDLNPVPPAFIMSGDEPGTIEKLDDVTVRFTFSAPHGLFTQYLATPDGASLTQHPRHYLEQFHQAYNPQVDQIVDDEEYPSWTELFLAKSGPWENAELPRIYPWVALTAVGEESRMVFERNPFYWKVDPDGSQLPYLDRVVYDYVNDKEVSLLQTSSGELDFEARRFSRDYAQKPVLAESREEGNYRLLDLRSTYAVSMGISLNLNHQDPAKREIFQNKDFRIGLSHGINRQEIIDTVFQRQGEPSQIAPQPDSPYYDEEMSKQYTEYDVDLANDHLDRAGYTERDGDDFRLGLDGNRISFAIDCEDVNFVPAVELVQAHLREVGVDVQARSDSRTLFYERKEAGEHDATARTAEGAGSFEPALRTDYWFPSTSESNNYAPKWAEWYASSGTNGEEPPEEVKRQIEIYRTQVSAATDEDERIEAMREVLQISKEFFFHIGVARDMGRYGVVRNDFHNVLDEFPMGWYYPCPAPTNPEQYFTTRK